MLSAHSVPVASQLLCVKAGASGGRPDGAGQASAGQARRSAMGQKRTIEGTTIFDGEQAAKGYQLNKMCYSFNDPENRKAFVADQAAYMDKYRLTADQRAALASGSVVK